VQGNEALESLVLTRLTQVGQIMVDMGNPLLATLELPVLETVGQGFGFQANAMTRLEFPKLASVGAMLQLRGNPALASVSLPALVTVGENIDIIDSAVLESVSLASQSPLPVAGIVGI